MALQVACPAVNGAINVDESHAVMRATIDRVDRQIAASKGFAGQDTKLVVLPEYCLTGFPMGEPLEVWAAKAACEPNGEHESMLGASAQRNGVYLSANVYETDAHFPGLYFQASLLWSPSGDCVLRYRRLHSLFAPTPHDVWEQYLDAYGIDSLFPVARTPIGNLACIASEEILFPELARALTFRGAEVFCHSTSEVGSPRQTPKDIAKLARAQENLAVVVSANSAGITDIAIPMNSTDGKSQVIDHNGRVLVEAGAGESMVANAEVDVESLRRARRRPGMPNLLARNRLELWTHEYGRAAELGLGHRAGNIDPAAIPDRTHFIRTHSDVIERLRSAGVVS